uniref:Lipid droplet-associated hydrolase n=1 Tax=Talaromyces marneffei PM1 TaxID=1077442 RepID=A0A093UUG0_TALMA
MTQIHHCRDFISLPSPSASPYHIFFLPGNPGLVEYYAKFLSLLHSALNQAPSTTQFNIAGCSYAGFETENSSSKENDGKLYDITEQVTFCLDQLQEYINGGTKDMLAETKPKVILIGHSFGTFVIAEIMKRLYTSSAQDEKQNYEIIGNIHLFPPIPDLAKSPRGVKAAVPPHPSPFSLLKLHDLTLKTGSSDMEIPPQHNVLHRQCSLQSSPQLVQCSREIHDCIPLGFGCIVYHAPVLW